MLITLRILKCSVSLLSLIPRQEVTAAWQGSEALASEADPPNLRRVHGGRGALPHRGRQWGTCISADFRNTKLECDFKSTFVLFFLSYAVKLSPAGLPHGKAIRQISSIRILLNRTILWKGRGVGARCSGAASSLCRAPPTAGPARWHTGSCTWLSPRFLPLFSSLRICKIFQLFPSRVGHDDVTNVSFKRRNTPSAAAWSSSLSFSNRTQGASWAFKLLWCWSWHWT